MLDFWKIKQLIGAMSMIGVLPLCYAIFFHGYHKTKGMKNLIDKFNLVIGQSSAQTFMNSILHAISDQVGHKFSIGQCENIICKVLRKKNLWMIGGVILFYQVKVFLNHMMITSLFIW